MTILQVIRLIADSPKIKTVVIGQYDDMDRFEAIRHLASIDPAEHPLYTFRINTTLEAGVMLLYYP